MRSPKEAAPKVEPVAVPKADPKTGETCNKSGVYLSDCGHAQRFDSGETFTACTRCQLPASWKWFAP